MKMMIVYEVYEHSEGAEFFCTLAKARKFAKARQEWLEPEDGPVRIYKTFVRTDLRRRALHVALLNGLGWQEGRDLVEEFPRVGEPATGDVVSEMEHESES